MTEKKGQFLLIKAHALNARVKGNAKQLKRSLSAAARHNTREFDEPNSDIDPTLTKRNTTLLGLPNSSAGILALKEAVHKEWGIESGRVDQTIAVEVVVSLRRTPNGISEDAYFAGAAKWARLGMAVELSAQWYIAIKPIRTRTSLFCSTSARAGRAEVNRLDIKRKRTK